MLENLIEVCGCQYVVSSFLDDIVFIVYKSPPRRSSTGLVCPHLCIQYGSTLDRSNVDLV